jgi:hypothetical protein
MATASLKLSGVTDLRGLLRMLPRDLVRDATGLLEAAGGAAVAEMRRAYPAHTGNLRDRVWFEVISKGVGTRVKVQNTAPHAHLYEFGTVVRHNAIGADRGEMPAGHVFWPIFDRWDRNATQSVIDLVEATGIRVIGSADAA